MENPNPHRKVWLKTFGCQMNYHDSERILSHLKELNFSAAENKEEADLLLFNTCAVRDLANKKFYSSLGEVRHLKDADQQKVVGICGCVSQVEGQELLKKYKHVDFAFGTDQIDQIAEMVSKAFAEKEQFFNNSWDQSNSYSIDTRITHGTPQAFVNIIKGCNNFCSYCIVPHTRGREISRDISEIVQDVRQLVSEQGIQEITLLGQNVNSFGKERNQTIAQLIMELDDIAGLQLLRYTSSNPFNLSDELIEVHGKSKKLSKHLHLPAQSGSNSVLKRMNRKYTVEHYLNLLKKLREAQPEIVLSSDIIVGFPGETYSEYQETIKLLDEAQFDYIYAYAYSPRPGTNAYKLKEEITLKEKKKRLYDLQQYQLGIQQDIRKQLVGKQMRVLVESSNVKNEELKWMGRSNCNRIVHFKPEAEDLDYKWSWVDVEITSTTALSLQGKLLENHGKCQN